MCDDNELMDMVQNGDRKAFETLVLKYRTQAITFANSMVMNFHTAEDIVQECFAKIYINRERYKPTFTFKTYLFTVIRNHSIDTLRKAKYKKEVSIESAFDVAFLETPEKVVLKEENKETVFAILNHLKDDYKIALILYAVYEMSYKDIALVMQKTAPQIKIIIYRARQKLKNLYGGLVIDEK